MKRTVVTLCGSTRFAGAYLAAQRRETLAGRIVLTVGLFGHIQSLSMAGPVKAALDELHLDKIEMSDEVLVLDCPLGWCGRCDRWYDYPDEGVCDCGAPVRAVPYVGDSTRREIAHAAALGKRIRYLSQEVQ